MSEPRYSSESHLDPSDVDDDVLEVEAEPQFGLVDVIEAFTAMRQEWRTQSRETRELSQSLETTTTVIADLEKRLFAAAGKIQEAATEATSDDASRRLAETIAEMDLHVVRAIRAVTRSSNTTSSFDASTLHSDLARDMQSLGAIGRWFARPLLRKFESTIKHWSNAQAAARRDDPVFLGLEMLVDRVERLMTDQHISRIETVGLLFDGETMNALEAIDAGQPNGTVVEQLSPAYVWRGRVLKYAQVRISK